MGVIFSTDAISFTPSARNADSSYPAVNVTDRWSLVRKFKSADALANDWLLKLDMASAKTVAAIVLNHVNFTSVMIEGNDTDVWTSPAFASTVSISKDPVVDRHKAFIPLTAFNYRYLRVFIPTGQTPTDDTVWSVGTVEVLDSYEELANNPASIPRTADIKSTDVIINDRPTDTIEHGLLLGWSGSLDFDKRLYSEETELWTLGNIRPGTLIILYENLSDTSRVYVVKKSKGSFYKGTLLPAMVVSGNTLDFEEVGV